MASNQIRPIGGLGWTAVRGDSPDGTTNTPEALILEIGIDEIVVPQGMRPTDEGTVSRIVESITEIGLQAQGIVTVEWAPVGSAQPAILVSGRHRLEAFRRLGWRTVPCAVFDGPADEAELWRISENLHRKELTALERADAIARWMRLRAEKDAQGAQVSGGRGHRGGISAAADELGIDRRAIQRGLQVAGLSDDAKTIATRLGLADNAWALRAAAHAGSPAAQIESLQAAAVKRDRQSSPELAARRRAKANQIWLRQSDWVNCAAVSLHEWLGVERVREFLRMVDKTAMPEIAPMMIVDHLRTLVRPIGGTG